MGHLLAVLLLALLAGCAAPETTVAVADVARDSRADVVLVGEQHDAAQHQQAHRQLIDALAARGRLGAVALEMAEQGGSTAGLPAAATEAAVQAALRWNGRAWPWEAYGPAVMAAVGAGVPVMGANLPRSQLRAAMADAAIDTLLPPASLQAQQQAIREGHCGLLPESQVAPMSRVQIARDRAMAQTLARAVAPGKAVVLLAGAGHVDPVLGVPQHLPAALRVRSLRLPAQPPLKDYCAELKEQMKTSPKP